MNLPWAGSRCILCLREAPFSRAHLIPKSLLGALSVELLCKECNEQLGSDVESSVKCDPRIRLAVEHLRASHPKLANALSNRLQFLATDGDNQVTGWLHKGSFRPHPQAAKNGSLSFPDEDVPAKLVEIEPEAARALDQLGGIEALPLNSAIPLTPKTSVCRRQVRIQGPVLTGPLVDNLFFVVLAYQLVALVVGTTIYDSYFDHVRKAILKRDAQATTWTVTGGRAATCSPWHALTLAAGPGSARVDIRLFECIWPRVNLCGLSLGSPRALGYRQWLDPVSFQPLA